MTYIFVCHNTFNIITPDGLGISIQISRKQWRQDDNMAVKRRGGFLKKNKKDLYFNIHTVKENLNTKFSHKH